MNLATLNCSFNESVLSKGICRRARGDAELHFTRECCFVDAPFEAAVVLHVQVVTAHAVRVAVTNNLSANISGFLPIHCIYQLLRSRAFTKHKVSIKVGGRAGGGVLRGDV